MASDYTTVTETPGVGASAQQIEMLHTRYGVAGEFCDRKDVLEVACGAGLGLGYLAKRGRRVVGGDYTESLLRMAKHHYGRRVPLVRLDAQALPFRSCSFDVILMYEAIYYLPSAEHFVAECRRVLRAAGTLVICTVNPEWSDFNPSPFSTRYLSAGELSGLLREHGFEVELRGAFRAVRESVADVWLSRVKRAAVAWHLIPRTMKGKEFLKRIVYGKLTAIPPEIDPDQRARSPAVRVLATDTPHEEYKVVFAVGRAG
jgi:SAM-dependent methyltransferase